jgi:hypothetical protein
MRFRFIEDRRADDPVTILCYALDVSPAGYYAWRSRPENQRSAANRELVDDIKRVHLKSMICRPNWVRGSSFSELIALFWLSHS